jgi:hypothetical protein
MFRHKFTCVSRKLIGSTIRVKESTEYAVREIESIRKARCKWKILLQI